MTSYSAPPIRGRAVQELVVLLDEEGRAIGSAAKQDVHHADTPLHLAFSCYVFDSAARLLVTRRALDKPTFPGAWTNTACGHPSPGEPLLAAVRRRVGEELGIVLTDLRIVLPRFRYRAAMRDGTLENEMCPVVTAVTAGQPVADPGEVAESSWVRWSEFSAAVLDGTREVSPWCREQVPQLVQLGDEPGRWAASPPYLLPAGARVG